MSIDDPRIARGLAAQTRARKALLSDGARRLGWKAGFGTTAAFEKLGTRAPLVGFMTDRTLAADGSVISIDEWRGPTLEPELAIRLGAPLGAGATRTEVITAIGSVGPAIEIIDLGASADVESILAGNIFHRTVLLGELRSLPAGSGLHSLRLEVHVDGRPSVLNVDPREQLGDLADVLSALADQLAICADQMLSGDVIITGSAVPALPLKGGERVTVTLSGFSSVTAEARVENRGVSTDAGLVNGDLGQETSRGAPEPRRDKAGAAGGHASAAAMAASAPGRDGIVDAIPSRRSVNSTG
jgi:2-oxo-3-hexenedioate decarboxylase